MRAPMRIESPNSRFGCRSRLETSTLSQLVPMAWQEMPVDRNLSAERSAGQLSRVSLALRVAKVPCRSCGRFQPSYRAAEGHGGPGRFTTIYCVSPAFTCLPAGREYLH